MSSRRRSSTRPREGKRRRGRRKRLRGRPRKLRRRRSALRRLRLSVRRCLRPRRPKRLKWLTRRNPLLEEKSMMPARSFPRPRSSLRKRRRLPSASESSHLNLRPWTLMKSRPRLRSSSRSSSSLRLTNMTMSRENSLRSLTSRSSRRDRRLSSELRPLRRVLTQRLSLESTHQRSACTPSMSVEQIPDLMMTERKCMREDGVVRAEHLESCWKEKYDEWSKRPSRRLPKWFGERPGKKKGDPETPEGGEEEEAAAAEEEEYDEE